MPVIAWWEEITVNAKPAPAVLTVTGGTPVVLIRSGRLSPAPAVLTVTGGVPAVRVSNHKVIRPAPAVLTIIGSRPALGTTLRPGAGELTVTGGTPDVRVSDHKRIMPAPAQLEIAGDVPEVAVTDRKTIRPAPAELTVSGGVPAVATPRTVSPAPAELVLTGGVPSVTVARIIAPDPAVLTVTGGIPVVSTPVVIRPAPAELVITGGRPVLDGSIELRPAGAELTVTGGVPAVTVSDHKRIVPAPAELVLTGGVPSVTVSEHQAIRPAAAVLTVEGGVPAIRVSDHKVIQPAAANIIITGGTPDVTVASVGPSAAVITLGTLLTGTPHGRININGVQGATVIAGLCGYYAAYNNSRNLRVNGVALPVLSQENAGTTSLTDLKMFQGVVADASGTWLVDTAANHDQSYNANCAAVVSGHTSITPKAAVVIPTGTTSVTVTPPTGGKSLVFIALQWGSSPDTTVSASGVTVVNDLRYTYSSIHMCVVDAETTLNISPAVLTGRSAGLLKQINVH